MEDRPKEHNESAATIIAHETTPSSVEIAIKPEEDALDLSRTVHGGAVSPPSPSHKPVCSDTIDASSVHEARPPLSVLEMASSSSGDSSSLPISTTYSSAGALSSTSLLEHISHEDHMEEAQHEGYSGVSAEDGTMPVDVAEEKAAGNYLAATMSNVVQHTEEDSALASAAPLSSPTVDASTTPYGTGNGGALSNAYKGEGGEEGSNVGESLFAEEDQAISADVALKYAEKVATLSMALQISEEVSSYAI